MKELDEEIAHIVDSCTVCHGTAKAKTYEQVKGGWIIVQCPYCRGTGRESYANK